MWIYSSNNMDQIKEGGESPKGLSWMFYFDDNKH